MQATFKHHNLRSSFLVVQSRYILKVAILLIGGTELKRADPCIRHPSSNGYPYPKARQFSQVDPRSHSPCCTWCQRRATERGRTRDGSLVFGTSKRALPNAICTGCWANQEIVPDHKVTALSSWPDRLGRVRASGWTHDWHGRERSQSV